MAPIPPGCGRRLSQCLTGKEHERDADVRKSASEGLEAEPERRDVAHDHHERAAEEHGCGLLTGRNLSDSLARPLQDRPDLRLEELSLEREEPDDAGQGEDDDETDENRVRGGEFDEVDAPWRALGSTVCVIAASPGRARCAMLGLRTERLNAGDSQRA